MSNKTKSAAALSETLKGHEAKEIHNQISGVIEIDANSKPVEAALTLWKNNILGAPVYDTRKTGKREYVGFIDMRDVLGAVIAASQTVCAKKKKSSAAAEDIAWTDAMTASMEELKLAEDDHSNVTLTYLAKRNPFFCCTAETPLADLCKLLADPRCHRVPIMTTDEENEEQRCVNMVSRSSLVRFMFENVANEDLEETLEDAGFEYKKSVITVKDSVPAFEAFEMMDSKNLSGLAVVDAEEGYLLGNVSQRDIKLAALDEGETAMEMDILSYLAAVRQTQISKNGKSRYPVAQIREGSTVSHVVGTLVKTGYHRVFVVDSNNCPVGVISVSDVLRFVLG